MEVLSCTTQELYGLCVPVNLYTEQQGDIGIVGAICCSIQEALSHSRLTNVPFSSILRQSPLYVPLYP